MKFRYLLNEAGAAGSDGGGGAGGGTAVATAPAEGSAASATNLLPAASAGATSATGDPAQGTVESPAAGAFSYGSLIGADGKFVQGHAEALAKAHPELADGVAVLGRYQDPVSLSKALVHAVQLNGRKLQGIDDLLAVSRDDEKGMALKREKLGIPTNAEGYDLKLPERLPDGKFLPAELKGSAEGLAEFAKFAFENDIPKEVAQKLVNFDASRAARAVTAAQQQAEALAAQQLAQDSATLKAELGGDYERKMDLLVRLLERGGMTREQISTTQSLRDLNVTRALLKLAAESGDDRLPASTSQSAGLDAGAQAKDIINNPANPLHKAYWNGDETANAKVQSLLKQEAAAKQQVGAMR